MSSQILDEVRESVYSITDHDDQFDQKDILNNLSSDFFVRRFLADNSGDVARTVQAIVKCLKYRVAHGINRFSDQDVAREAMETERCKVGRGVDGQVYILDKIGLHRKMPSDMLDYTFKITALAIDKVTLTEKVNMIMDASSAGCSSMDMQMTLKSIEINNVCYPGVFGKVYIFGLPTMVRPFFNLVMKVLPEKYVQQVVFVSREEAESLMGCGPEIKLIDPKNCSSLDEVGHKFGFKAADVEKTRKYWSWVKEEARKRR